MGIRRFFTTSVVIARAKDIGGVGRRYSSTATVSGHIQELDSESRLRGGITSKRAWRAWFPEDADIQDGDQLILSGVTYSIIDKTVKDYGINRHTEIVMEELNA